MLNFGSVFKHGDRTYVYLGSDGDILFAAMVLELEHTKRLQSLSDMRAKDPNHTIHQGALFCFVILSTEELTDRAAWLNQTDKNVPTATPIEPYTQLNGADTEALKNQILEDGVIPPKLKEIIKATFSIS